MGHDQFFKDFFRTFFRDFLELFYPDISAELDFGTVRFADKEVFTDFPDGSMRTADVVAELQTSDGVEKLVLVHIEVELNWGSDFGEQMYEYYTLLQQRFRNEIIPIAVFLHGGGDGVVEETYKRASLGRRRLQFWYESVSLAHLDAEEYVGKGNPVAAALAALINRRKAREPLTLRALMIQAVVESELGDIPKLLLMNLIEVYFELGAAQAKRFEQVFSEEFREAEEMEVMWADRMKAKWAKEGLEEGREKGLIEGRREALLRQLAKKFGSLSEDVTAHVRALESVDEIDVYLDRVLSATSLEEMELDV